MVQRKSHDHLCGGIEISSLNITLHEPESINFSWWTLVGSKADATMDQFRLQLAGACWSQFSVSLNRFAYGWLLQQSMHRQVRLFAGRHYRIEPSTADSMSTDAWRMLFWLHESRRKPRANSLHRNGWFAWNNCVAKWRDFTTEKFCAWIRAATESYLALC